MSEKLLSPGLNGSTSVGSCGQYRAGIEEDVITLNTVVWRAGWFALPGKVPPLLYNYDLPDDYRFQQIRRDWTGKTLRYDWAEGGFDLDLRTTLPGPLFTLRGTALTLRFNYTHEPRRARDLEEGTEIPHRGGECHGRFWLMDMQPHPLLIVADRPVKRISAVNHRHWTFHFAEPGARVFALPLLDEADAPTTPDRQELWRGLVEQPPLSCEESFAFTEKRQSLRLVQHFPGAGVVARSPLIENVLDRTDAVSGERGHLLLKGWFGPYAVHPGDTVETQLQTDWLNYAAVPTREPAGDLQPLPDEPSLAFPGDGTWDIRNVGDRLMAWRLWAPHWQQLPADTRDCLVEQLNVPTAEEWQRDIQQETETINGGRWARHRDLWEPIGDVAYDYDWYNGMALSGLGKACDCADPEIARAARKLAVEGREIRDDMIRYFEIYHDWRLGMSWTDTFGTLWNLDCGHNGLEGLLGEIRLRLLDDDPEGAEQVAYLAAKTGVAILATFFIPDWLRKNVFQPGDVPLVESSFGMKGAYPAVRWAFFQPEVRNPYPLPRRSPQFSALLKLHGPREQLADLLRTWENDLPIRYQNWRKLNLDPPPEIQVICRRTAVDDNPDPGGVESGDFGISMHAIQPEILLRTLVFEQDPDEVEALYADPLLLPEQLLLRAGYRLQRLDPEAEHPGALR